MLKVILSAIHTQILTQRIIQFYRQNPFIPAPRINLSNPSCIKRIADDITLFGKDAQLYTEIKKLAS
jgi:hypothetical protein